MAGDFANFVDQEMNMSQFSITNESTEDTLESSDNLQDAIRIALKVAKQGQAGDPVSIIGCEGKAIRQFVLMPDGGVTEQAIACQARPCSQKY